MPAGIQVELPEVVARLGRCVAAVRLIKPLRLSPSKKSAGMVVNGGQVRLLQRAPRPLPWLEIAEENAVGHIHKVVAQHGLAHAVFRAQRPAPAEQLVGGELERFFLVVQVFTQSGWRGIGQVKGEWIVVEGTGNAVHGGVQYLAGDGQVGAGAEFLLEGEVKGFKSGPGVCPGDGFGNDAAIILDEPRHLRRFDLVALIQARAGQRARVGKPDGGVPQRRPNQAGLGGNLVLRPAVPGDRPGAGIFGKGDAVVGQPANQLQRLKNLPLMVAVKTDAPEQRGDFLICCAIRREGKNGNQS